MLVGKNALFNICHFIFIIINESQVTVFNISDLLVKKGYEIN